MGVAKKIFARFRSRNASLLPGEEKTTLNASYSDRKFAITGLSTDISVLRQIVKTGGVWEPHIMNLLARITRKNSICLDIGANIGALTLVLADLASEGVVHAFEPSGINARFLAMNIRQNRLRHTYVHAIGMGSAPGQAEFTNLVGMAGCSFVNPVDQAIDDVVASAWGANVEKKSEVVTIDTLDRWVERQQLRRIDLVKMDVEGCELAVLDGGRTTFTRHRPKLIIELNRNTLRLYFGIDPKALFDRLCEIYPYIYLINEDVTQTPKLVVSFAEIQPLLEIQNHWWVDLLCQIESL